MSDLDRERMPYNTPEARAARIHAPAAFDGMHFNTYPREVPRYLAEWLSAYCATGAHRGVVLYGKPGLGKTALGVCALRCLAEAGVGSTFQWNMVTAPGVRAAVESGDDKEELAPVWFERFSRLLALNRRANWDEEDWFEKLEEHVHVLMLDDVGVDTGTPYRESFLLRHIDWAFDFKRYLVLTMNPHPSQWQALLGERIADRLLDSRWFLKVPFVGDSLR